MSMPPSMNGSRTAFELLFAIDQRCRSLASGLPAQPTREQDWSGIGFRLGEHLFVTPMGEVAEILNEPRYTAMPGVKPWVLGVANLRGRLLPVIDLCGYFGHERSLLRKQRQVLVVEQPEVFAGLLVDEVLGMQHFDPASLVPGTDASLSLNMAPFVRGQFIREQPWRVFSTRALAQSEGFMDVAL